MKPVLAIAHKCHMKHGRPTVPNQDFHFPNPAVAIEKKKLEFEYD
jgi:hypothetical protein